MAEPLTPADCDLRGLPFMPLDVVRLIDSDLFAVSTGDEFKAAVALWCKSWLQVPAASLPDDDRVLAHLSGAGARWAKVKEVALRNWVKCDDGRLYHPVVAAKALEAWKHRQLQKERSRRGNAARWGSQEDTQTDPTSIPTGIAAASPRGSPRASQSDPHGDPYCDPKGQGQLKGQGERKKEREPARGARLTADWCPSASDAEFATSLGLDWRQVLPGFRDFWLAKAGADARKLDWSATWRNWCRREKPQRPAPQKPKGKLAYLAEFAPQFGFARPDESPTIDGEPLH